MNLLVKWQAATRGGFKSEVQHPGLRISGSLDIKFGTGDTVFGTAVSELV